jgi:hypothetical protein
MAQTEKKNAETRTEHNQPTHVAWHVTGGDEKKFWNRIGVAWAHKDGKGFNLQLETLPVDGRVVLRTAKEKAEGRA